MRVLIVFLLLISSSALGNESSNIIKNTFLSPYVEQLEKELSATDHDRIRNMAQSELILLHIGYGMYIRNKWFYGNRNPELIRFFRNHGIDHPDQMSGIMIDALWNKLNSNLSKTERASIKAMRKLVARKRSTYKQLKSECKRVLTKAKAKFEHCYAKHGMSSMNPQNREPFYKLIVEKTGSVSDIVFFQGATPEIKECLEKPIQQFKFSAFNDDPKLTLYINSFPNCGVEEEDTLNYR